MAKRPEQPTQFCVVPRKSIKFLAESVGIDYLSSEAAGALAEDVTYRIRETIQKAISFVKHSKRDHLTGEDINRALFWSHVEPIYGYGSKNSNIFSSISTKDGDIFFHEDKEVNLRELTFSKGLSSLSELGKSDSKIGVEVSLLDKSKATTTEEGSSSKCFTNFNALSPVFKSYYQQLTRNIIDADENTVKIVLADLRGNPRVQVLLPFLANFITTGIKLLTGDFEKLLRLFTLIRTLVDNKDLYLEPYVVQFVRAVMYCLIEKPLSQSNGSFDEWNLRNAASQTLCYIDRKCNNTSNYLHHQLLRTLKDFYEKNDRPLISQYGAIIGLSMLGLDAVEQTILPRFKMYAQHLNTLPDLNSSASELSYIMDALKISAISVFRNKLRTLANISVKDSQSDTHKARVNKSQAQATSTGSENSYNSNFMEQSKWNQDICDWYNDVYYFCGESFILLIGNLEDFKHFVPVQCQPSASSRVTHHAASLVHIKNLITHALQSKGKKGSEFPSTFSLPIKRRRLSVTERVSKRSSLEKGGVFTTWSKYKFYDRCNSEIFFTRLIEKSFTSRNPNRYDWRSHVGKCRHHVVRRTSLTKRKSLFSLSSPL